MRKLGVKPSPPPSPQPARTYKPPHIKPPTAPSPPPPISMA